MSDSDISDVTTVVIISDTHGELDTRIADVIRQSDIAVHAGDIGDASVLDAMQPKSGQVVAVSGNNDHPMYWPHAPKEVLDAIPTIAEIELPGGQLSVEHGDRHCTIAPDHARLRDAFPRSRLVIYGHTHKLTIDKSHSPWVVNPGAAGKTRTHGGPSCLLLKATADDWEIETIRFEVSNR